MKISIMQHRFIKKFVTQELLIDKELYGPLGLMRSNKYPKYTMKQEKTVVGILN